jgi:hypothetical protein
MSLRSPAPSCVPDEPRGAKPPRREDHRALRRKQLRLPLWRGRGRVAAGDYEVALEMER